jgi:nucleoside-diphosphate-sugar epimerase
MMNELHDDLRPTDTSVLVTGGTGYLGGHTVVRLLADGYRVRTTVRSLGREAELRASVAAGGADPARLEIVRADLSADEGWDAATGGVHHVLHIASPFPASAPADDDEIIRPAREGTRRVLAAARGAGVRRVVMTSSFAAVGYSAQPRDEYTEEDWTDLADPNTAYIRSKVIAEQAAWDDVRERGGPELTVINPVGIFGPVLGPQLSASVGLVKAMLQGQMPAMPRTYFGVVDVRDVADLHVRAMTHPQAAGRRFLAVAGASLSFLEMARILVANLGDAAAGAPTVELTDAQVRAAAETDPRLREAVSRLGHRPVISSARARAVLGWEPRDVESTIVDTAASLLTPRR